MPPGELSGAVVAAATSLGAWIRLRRRALGITQAELASRVPCAVITIRKLEADERRPSRQVAERLAEALELGELAAERFLASAGTSFAPKALPDDADAVEARSSVPAATSPLVGRGVDLDDAFARLSLAGGGARLLTITGPPGVGKTRLAMALAERIQDKLELPVAWVDLAGVGDPTVLPVAISRAVTPPSLQGAPLEDLAIRMLRRGPVVLVLDNCEHLLAGMDHVSALLEACPALVCVATSRSRLDLHGEHELKLEPLAVLGPDGSPGAAIELFIERALETTRLPPSPDDPLVRSVVERVGGIPLGIELAALRLRDHDLAGLETSLASGPGVLGPNRRGVPVRHASLSAAVAWSESLLGPSGQAALEALVVFPAGAEADAVASVAGLDAVVVGAALSELVEAALVFRRSSGGPTARYVPFVVVREHVRSRLDPGRVAEACRRHAAVVLDAVTARLPGIAAWPEPEHLAALDDLDADLRAALSWCFGPGGDPDVGIELAVPAMSAWFFRGRAEDCVEWIARALAARPGSYKAMYLDAIVAWEAGSESAAEKMEAACTAAQAADDLVWIAECAGMIQTIALSHGDLARAARLGPRAVATSEAVGGEWEALAQLRSGGLALRLGDLEAARNHSRRCTECYDLLDSTWGQGVAAQLAGSVAAAEGRPSDAARAYLRSIERFSILGFPTYIAGAITDCAYLLLHVGHTEHAAVLYGMVETWLDELGVRLEPMSRAKWIEGRDEARRSMGAAYDTAAAQGASEIRDLESVRAVLADAGLDIELDPKPE